MCFVVNLSLFFFNWSYLINNSNKSQFLTPPDISLIRDFRIPSHFHLSSYSVFNLSNFVMLLFIY